MSCSVRTATSGVVKPWSSGRTSSAGWVLEPSASCQLSTSLCALRPCPRAGRTGARARHGVAREHDLASASAKLGDMVCDGLIDIRLLRALGREIARRLDLEVDGPRGFGLGERRGEVDRPLGDSSAHSFLAGRARRVRAGDSCRARLPSPERGSGNNPRSRRAGRRAPDRCRCRAGSGRSRRDDRTGRSRSSISGSQCSMPAIGGRRTTPGRAGPGRGAPKCLAIARAESLDAVLVEQRLGRGHQGEAVGLVGRALVGGVETAHAVDLVAEEIEAQRQLLAGRETGRSATRGPHIRHARRPCRRAGSRARSVARSAPRGRSARPRRCGGSAGECGTGSAALGRGAGGRDQQLRPVAFGLERDSGSPAARPSRAAPARRGRRAGIPAGKVRTSTSGANSGTVSASARIAASSATIATARPFCRAVRRAREIGGEPRQEAGRDAGKGQGTIGAKTRCSVRSSRDPDVIELCSASIIGPAKRSGGQAFRSPRP